MPSVVEFVRVRRFSSIHILLVSILGCGTAQSDKVPTYPVEADVLFQGRPIPGALVTLHPAEPSFSGPIPRASVDKNGGLRISTYDHGDGAPEGKYVVTVQWYKLVKNGTDLIPGPNVLPRKYASPKRSKIEVVVRPEVNTLPPIRL